MSRRSAFSILILCFVFAMGWLLSFFSHSVPTKKTEETASDVSTVAGNGSAGDDKPQKEIGFPEFPDYRAFGEIDTRTQAPVNLFTPGGLDLATVDEESYLLYSESMPVLVLSNGDYCGFPSLFFYWDLAVEQVHLHGGAAKVSQMDTINLDSEDTDVAAARSLELLLGMREAMNSIRSTIQKNVDSDVLIYPLSNPPRMRATSLRFALFDTTDSAIWAMLSGLADAHNEPMLRLEHFLPRKEMLDEVAGKEESDKIWDRLTQRFGDLEELRAEQKKRIPNRVRPLH